jgi:hypothetical protein
MAKALPTCCTSVPETLETEVDAGRLDPPMDLDDLAYIMVRPGESVVNTDVITGGEPDSDKAEKGDCRPLR